MRTIDWQWYIRRLCRMSPNEVAWRLLDYGRSRWWSARVAASVRSSEALAPVPAGWAMVAPGAVELDADSRREVLASADRLLAGEWEVLGATRGDMADPDWFADGSGGFFPRREPSVRTDYRSGRHGDVKQVWELSRHQHLTVLALAWRLTGDERYAGLVDRQLRSWWSANPPMVGVNWTSGIELGLRLISWVWTRRLLDGWTGAPALFEDNPVARDQVRWHQRYLAAFESRGSSANNHAVAELAGQLVASCAFAWYPESPPWRRRALAQLVEVLRANTFDSGVNRELASDYHLFVLELGLLGALEASAAGIEVPTALCDTLRGATDALAALVDDRLSPPRQGDSDDGRVLLLGDPSAPRVAWILSIGRLLFGPLPWWPDHRQDPKAAMLPGLPAHPVPERSHPSEHPARFADAGVGILRSRAAGRRIWCRCDGGPLGFGRLAAHAHADALSIEVRCDGVDILADPGTFCYHGNPPWRQYFRSTIAHNTIELDHRDQSISGGPFLWRTHARTTEGEWSVSDGEIEWSAHHDGYSRPEDRARHHRTVTLLDRDGLLKVVDVLELDRPHTAVLAYHLGPAVAIRLAGCTAELTWASTDGIPERASLALPPELSWMAHRGEENPPLGWYSPAFGVRLPTTALLGSAAAGPGVMRLETRLTFGGGGPTSTEAVRDKMPQSRAEGTGSPKGRTVFSGLI